ncbi:MAG: glycosyl hydrolase family 18 protein [Candidatus Hydrothermales bacterium]
MNVFIIFSFLTIHEYEYYKNLKKANFNETIENVKFSSIEERLRGITHTFYGYLPYWVDTLLYQYFQMELITHISYFATSIDPATGNLGSVPNLSRFYKIINYAHPRGVKVHMTFIIFGSSNVSQFLNNKNARNNAINKIKDFVTNYNIDGVNIDFEFVTASVRDSFSKFINDLYYTLINHPQGRKELFIATPAIPEWYPGYNISYLSTHSDGLFVMAYDFHYSGSSVAGPVSPLIPSSQWGPYCVSKSIRSYKQYGANPDKIILGMPYYGYNWPTQSSQIGSSTRGSGDAVIFYYAKQNSSNYGRLWDINSLTPWYRYYISGDGWYQTWYDDSVSIDLKIKTAVDSGLSGIGCWALGYDRSEDDLWNVIRSNLWIENPNKHFVVRVYVPDELNIYESPDFSSRVISIATFNSKFVSFLYKNNFYKIYFPAGTGYYYGYIIGGDGINQKFLCGSNYDKVVRVNASLLNVRTGPSTSFQIITQIARGQSFVTDSSAGSWLRIFIGEVGGYQKGWIHSNYVRIIQNPEDSNKPHIKVLSLSYPQQVFSQDTFSIFIFSLNSGYVSFDSFFILKSVRDSSYFYNPQTFIDKRRAELFSAYNALPFQNLLLKATFKAPDVSVSSFITESFYFERKLKEFGDTFVLGVQVDPRIYISDEKTETEEKDFTLSSNILDKNFKINIGKRLKIFDMTGRRVLNINEKKATILFINVEGKKRFKVIKF